MDHLEVETLRFFQVHLQTTLAHISICRSLAAKCVNFLAQKHGILLTAAFEWVLLARPEEWPPLDANIFR